MSLLVSSCFSCATLHGLTNTDPIKKAYQSVGRLSAISKDGKKGIFATGFAIDDKHIMSAAHFCISAFEGSVKGQWDEKINIMFVYHNDLIELKKILEIELIEEKTDICILRGNPGLVPVEFVDNYSKVQIGDKIHTVGASLSLFPILSEGTISVPKMDVGDGERMLFASIHVSPGNSGGPVFSEDGKVIGMVLMQIVPVFVLSADSPFCLAQRSDVLKRFAKMMEEE